MKLILLIFLFYSNADLFKEPLDSLLLKGLDFAYREKYKEAQAYFDLAIKFYPEHPGGYLYKAGLLDLYMIDFSTDDREEEFYKLVDIAAEKARKMRRDHIPEDLLALSYFFEGSAFSYRAVREGRKKKFISALKYGFKAVKLLKKSVELDSSLYDAYLPLGTYSYALSKIPRVLRWFLPDDGSREDGLKKIELAAKKAKYVKILAMDAYAWTLAYDGQADSAVKVAQKLVEIYPGTRAFRWTLSYALRKAGKWREAEKTHRVIFYLTVRDQKDYPYDIALSLYWLAICNYINGRKTEAIVHTDAALLVLREAPDNPKVNKLRRGLEKLDKKLEKYRRLGTYVDPAGVEDYGP